VGFQIELDSNLDYYSSYEAIRFFKCTYDLCEGRRGGFGFSLKRLERVRYRVHGTGRVQIFTDDWSDPAILIDIARCLLVDHHRKPVNLTLRRGYPLTPFKDDFWPASRRKRLGIPPSAKWEDPEYLMEWEDRYVTRVHEACENLNNEEYWYKVYKEHSWPRPGHLKSVEPELIEAANNLASVGESIHFDPQAICSCNDSERAQEKQ